MINKGKVRFIGVVEKAGSISRVKIYPEFQQGIHKLEAFSHLHLIYWFHLRDSTNERGVIQVTPPRHPGAPKVGVFSSRSPSRPNPIGICAVKLIKIDDGVLYVEGSDALEGSPVVDIKPYIPKGDSIPDAKTPSWMTTCR